MRIRDFKVKHSKKEQFMEKLSKKFRGRFSVIEAYPIDGRICIYSIGFLLKPPSQ